MHSLSDGPPRPKDEARVRGEGHVVRVRLERPSDNASFGQTEAGVEMTQGVAGVCRAECCIGYFWVESDD